MSNLFSDLKRIGVSSGVYAVGQVLSHGLAFFLLPVYTRFLDKEEYGSLELLNTLTGILFTFLLLGLPSAVNKCYHRDCRSSRDRRTVLPAALAVDLPVLAAGGILLVVFSDHLGLWITGKDGMGVLVRLVAGTTIATSLLTIVLAYFRAREMAGVYVGLSVVQFIIAFALSILLVVVFRLGIPGVLWGNLASVLIALPVALWIVRRSIDIKWNPPLVGPLLYFGLLVFPATLSAWVMDLSDRFVLRIYESLDQIAVYAVGYKIGMVLQVAVVWPFQLAWPAVSFSISRREEYQGTYARVMTYFLLTLAWGVLALSLIARGGLAALAGGGYETAYQVVPWVALGYLFNGVHFCASPGIHIVEKTKYLLLLHGMAAVLNLGLNFMLVPRYGYPAAAWSTTLTFFVLAVATMVLSQRFHPVPYEYNRLAKVMVTAGAVYGVAVAFEPETVIMKLCWHGAWVTIGFPALLVVARFLLTDEREQLRAWAARVRATLR